MIPEKGLNRMTDTKKSIAATLEACERRCAELHANGERLKEAADGWKAEAERLRGIERALEDANRRLAVAVEALELCQNCDLVYDSGTAIGLSPTGRTVEDVVEEALREINAAKGDA